MERFKIEWTPEANEDYIDIIKYVEAVWGLNAALNFMEKTDEIIEVLEIFPKSFPAVHSDRIRRALLLNIHRYITALHQTVLNFSIFGTIEEILLIIHSDKPLIIINELFRYYNRRI